MLHFIVVIVVDDLAFTSNLSKLMKDFKERLSSTFRIELFRVLKTFIGWEIKQCPDGLSACHGWYVDELLRKHNMDACNETLTPMAINADIRPALQHETILGRKDHNLFRNQIKEHLSLAICTRPDILYALCALARSLRAPTK